MIPKNLFFVWFGNEIPKYVFNVINTFKFVNPDFDVKFIHKTVDQIENIYYKNIIKDEYDKILTWHVKHSYNRIINEKKKMPFLMDLYDTFRFGLLCKYGGVFLDCDMFPVKPFDDDLLNCDFFKMKRIHYGKEYIEGGFCGCVKNSKLSRPKVVGCIRDTELLTNDLKNKFFNCTLKYGEHYSSDTDGNYVEHYGNNTWNPKRCTMNKTKMDVEIECKIHNGINFI